MNEPYTPLDRRHAAARLAHRVLLKVAARDERPDLLDRYERDGGRLEDVPGGGLAIFVADELVAELSEEALALGLALEDANRAD